MFGCLTSVRYTMLATVQKLTVEQDPNSGAITRTWQNNRDVPVYARAILPRVMGTENIGQVYTNLELVRLLTAAPISVDDRVTAIRDAATGEYIWKEDFTNGDIDEGTNTPSVFNVKGCTPLIDLLGRVKEYQVVLERTDV